MARPLLLVTGMAEGLGAEIAATFARAGHDVVRLARSDRAAEHVRSMVEQAGSSYTHLACDVAQAAEVTPSDSAERVALEHLAGGSYLSEGDCPGGEEIFLLYGTLRDEYGSYEAGTWIRNPAGFRRSLQSPDGAEYWVKRGHLRPMP